MKPQGFLLLMLGILAVCPTQARDRLVRHFDQLAGLPVASVGALAQDTNGFLWIGPNGGLVRWDGRELRPWANSPGPWRLPQRATNAMS